ncbi:MULTISPECIES: alpha/beta hydrolase family protein [Streptomyces]|uniref:alpha/beta hydrolase family protein n=1 Tax=Streptomyces TaxID=1883 RepID=UPI00224895BB|nr:CocE/NonD family hydrolase [Streptomyces sp. JHD 1]MCX2967284.1 alpha/beta hydrolase [Streptomyces sp. JHD 1]
MRCEVPRRRWRSGLVWTVVAALSATGAGFGVVVVRHSYDLRERAVTFQHAGETREGVLALPAEGDGPHGLVVFVHGDGPVDATHDSFYRPLWESFARAGYASLSWHKPGVAGTEGDWLAQSMADRADEARAAIAWARGRPEVDPGRIGLWGASQAGWVLPRVAAQEPAVRFVVAVSPAVNWHRQGRHHLLAELRHTGASDAERAAALQRRARTLKLLRRGASYDVYRAAFPDDPERMSARRWRFVSRNHTADATADLAALPAGVAVLLVLAGHDRNVDTAETEAVYRAHLPDGRLTVAHYPGATHSLVREDLDSSPTRLTLTALFAPRALFAPGFLEDQRRFVRRVAPVADGAGVTG